LKIRPLDPSHRLSIDLYSFSRRLALRHVIHESHLPKTETLTIVANGSPDNRVIFLLLYLHDGEPISDMVFPEYKGISIADHVHEYVPRNYREILLVLDQERYHLNEIHETFRDKILGLKSYEVIQESASRTAVAKIEYQHTAHLILVINGTDDERFSRHTIEDHLLLLAEKLGLHSIRSNVNPKDEWKNLDRNVQNRVYEAIRDKIAVNEIFRQHVMALNKLKNDSLRAI